MHRRNFASNTVGGEGGEINDGYYKLQLSSLPPPQKKLFLVRKSNGGEFHPLLCKLFLRFYKLMLNFTQLSKTEEEKRL